MLARRLAATCIARPTLSRRYAVASARKVAAHKPAAASAVEHHEDPQNVAEPTGSVSSQLSRPSVDRSESIITPIYKSDVANPANLDLVQMLTAYHEVGNTIPGCEPLSKSFGLAARHVANCPDALKSEEDINKIRRRDPYVMEKIFQHVRNKSDKKPVEKLSEQDIERTLRAESQKRNLEAELMKVPFLGRVKARRLIAAGCQSLEQLLTDPRFRDMISGGEDVTNTVELQSKLFRRGQQDGDIWEKGITQLATFVQDSMGSTWKVMPLPHWYRDTGLGAEACVLLAHPSQVDITIPGEKPPQRLKWGTPHATPLQGELQEVLQSRGVMASVLGARMAYWEAIVRVPVQHPDGSWETRRERADGIKQRKGTFYAIRFQLASTKNMGAVAIDTTGPRTFCQALAKIAAAKGLLLNGDGLWRYNRVTKSAGQKTPSPVDNEGANKASGQDGYWELLPSGSEEEIFEQLDIPWIDSSVRGQMPVWRSMLRKHVKQSA